MLLADVMEAMAGAGCSPEQMTVVANSLDQRSPAAKRQALYRARKRNESVTPDHNENATKRNAPDHNESVTNRNATISETSQSVTDVTPYARVEDNPLTSEHTGKNISFASLTKRVRVRVRVHDERFDRFWTVWPHKVEKSYAEKCFAKVAEEVDAIIDGVTRYVREKPPDRPWLNPSTFLNRRRWEDQPAPTAAGANRGKGQLANAADKLVRRLDEQFAYLDDVRPPDRGQDGAATVRVLPGVGRQRS
jgi:hypothetical protein